MIRLEDMDTKEELIKDFFTWLFDDMRIKNKSVSLHKEIDISLAPYYTDPNIYFPKQIADFFETKAMKRLGRISQLALANDIYPNIYHNRLEHSKGVYYRKLEEFLYNYQNLEWRKKIEKNNQKIYLLADLIKMAGHDIGHLPLSHLMEVEIFSYRGAHEDIGKRIMLEDQEIQTLLQKISPELPNVLRSLYENHIMNFREHDESSFDVDRLDYITRDFLYFGNPSYFPYTRYETIPVEVDSSGKPKEQEDNSIRVCDKSSYYIDVYDETSLKEIEDFLRLRLKGYEKIYSAPLVAAHEMTISTFFHALKTHQSECSNNLQNLVTRFRSQGINNINLDEFLNWDDITLYSEILNIAETHNDKNIRDLATMTIPSMEAFLNLIYSHLQVNSKSNEKYTTTDLDFLRKIKHLIKSNSELSLALRDPSYTDNNIILFNKGIQIPKLKSSTCNSDNIFRSYQLHKKAYNQNEPIYIRDSSGKIFELSKHPQRRYNFNDLSINFECCFGYIPYLRLCGISEEEIESLRKSSTKLTTCHPDNSATYKSQINMQPLKVGNNIEHHFLKINTEER